MMKYNFTLTLILSLCVIPVFFNSELASVKAHDREVTQQARYAQDEVILLPCDSRPVLKLYKTLFLSQSFRKHINSFLFPEELFSS